VGELLVPDHLPFLVIASPAFTIIRIHHDNYLEAQYSGVGGKNGEGKEQREIKRSRVIVLVEGAVLSSGYAKQCGGYSA
jgi:hypothetical protein